MENKGIRLQKIIAENSDYSRRKAEALIQEGKVKINGKVVREMGVKVTGGEEIIVDGSVLYTHEKVYILVNKPIRVISSRSDDKERTVITDLVHEKEKLYPVGRLDYNTSGLIILTNDGEMANGLMHPKFKIPKTYIAKVKGDYTRNDLFKLANGVEIDGYMTGQAKVKSLSYDSATKTGKVEITIYEGRNLQIRKMFLSIETKVLTLKRVGYSIFHTNTERIGAGDYRHLTPKEVKQLYYLINKE